MDKMNDIVKLAVDTYKGTVQTYSKEQANDALHEALIEANGGNTKLNYRNIRDGKCVGLFALVEEILKRTTSDGLQEDMFFTSMVDYRDTEEGDQNLFVVKDSTLFTVSDTADGTQGVRRQRIGGEKEVVIPTTMKTVRIYEELNRVLSGRVDFNDLIKLVADSFKQRLLQDIYNIWSGVTADQLGGTVYYPGYGAAGSFSENTMLDLISHVEAAAGGKTPIILGTKKAVRRLQGSIMSDDAKNDLYHNGVYGSFYGTPVIVTPQRHAAGTTNFVLDDNVLTVVAGDVKPIKVVREGNPLVIMGDPLTNADLTQEYLYGEKYGTGIVLDGGNGGIGRYIVTG